ncbi:hypothetical protein [Clostridioides difficile]|uniref:hypothetical protein n=2 Tax=Clostridioides TaxID=1870884 RepID=UPI000D1E14D8|nr:hypothetical protein [Clostridioides difficile]
MKGEFYCNKVIYLLCAVLKEVMNIFKKLDLELANVTKALLISENNDSEYAMLLRRKNLLLEINKILNSYTWLHSKTLVSKIKYFINNNYSYDALANEYSIKNVAARTCISRAGKEFKNTIGKEILMEAFGETILYADSDLSDKFNLNRGRFILELRSKLPDALKSENVKLLDCKREIMFLHYFTLKSFQEKFNTLSLEKLSYLMWILEINQTTIESILLDSYLKSEIDFESFIKKLEEEIN